MQTKFLAAAFALSLLSFAPEALAADDPPAHPNADAWDSSPSAAEPEKPAPVFFHPATPPPPERRWYGYQILLPSGIFDLTNLLLTFGANVPAARFALFTASSFSGTVVHAIHGNPGRAVVSFALHALPLALGTMSVWSAAQCDGEPGFLDDCEVPITYLALLFVAPLAMAATAIDVGALAFEDVPAAKAESGGLSVAPYIVPTAMKDERTGQTRPAFTLGLAGQF